MEDGLPIMSITVKKAILAIVRAERKLLDAEDAMREVDESLDRCSDAARNFFNGPSTRLDLKAAREMLAMVRSRLEVEP